MFFIKSFIFFCTIYQLEASLKWEDYNVCCHFCRANPQNFVTVKPSWNISAGDVTITDFRWPAVYFLDDVSDGHMHLLDGSYVIRQAGAPVTLTYEGFSNAQTMLTSQYIEVDMMLARAVAGVTIQGGFVEDLGEELLERYESWVTSYVVSYSPSRTAAFQFVTDDSGNTQIFKGNKDATSVEMTSFWNPLQVQIIRVHPLGAASPDGPTKLALARVGVVTCHEDNCYERKIHCEVTPWLGWGECVCSYDGCAQKRIRIIHRYNSCGGAGCPDLEETRPCDAPFATWKIIVIGVVCGLVVLVLLIILVAKLVQYYQARKEEKIFRKRGTAPENNEASTSTSTEEIRDVDENEAAFDNVPDEVKKKRERKAKENKFDGEDNKVEKQPDQEEDANQEIDNYLAHGFQSPPPYK